jgi:hypothetical protein
MKKTVSLLLLFCLIISCKSKLKPRELGAFEYKTSCVSNNNSILIVSSWGTGLTKEACELAAIKKAITDLAFKGILDGNVNCQQPAILTSIDAQKKVHPFMSTFLNDENGKFVNYAKIYNKPRSQNRSKKERKLDRVENIALEFQIEVDIIELTKILKQAINLENNEK